LDRNRHDDPYSVMINAIRVRVEHNPVMLGGYRTELEARELQGYREACFDILEELAVIRSKEVPSDA
jgi:hypothetical protein